MSVLSNGKHVAGLLALIVVLLLRIGPAQAADMTFRVGAARQCGEM